MEYYEYLFETLVDDQKDILIALLSDAGFTGFEEEENSLKACINVVDLNEIYFDNIISTTKVKYSRSIIKEINWNEKWESGFDPVSILYPGTDLPFVYLRAGFHKKNEIALLDIEITPKMSFGTGHHATTYLMIEQMSKIDFKGRSVIDFGTGTGVLAILAEKLGSENIVAIDNDDWSIDNAKENIITNKCEHISLIKAETISAIGKADIILANINLNIIIANLIAIKNAAKQGAIVLFSGIMVHDEPLIVKALKENEIEIMEVFNKNGWIALLTKR